MPNSLDEMIEHVDAMLAEFDVAEEARCRQIAAVAPVHAAGAVNLVDYVTLRRHDLRHLQSALMDVGATAMSTPEANVRAKLTAARAVLTALRGDGPPVNLAAVELAFEQGYQLLDARARELFGDPRPGRRTRIMVTLPSEAADDVGLVERLVAAGMDVARINCAHDDEDVWERMARNVRKAAAAAGRRVLISMDIAGPKIRTGPIEPGPAVARARIRRDDIGRVISTAQLHLVAAGAPLPVVVREERGSRAAVTARCDLAWLRRRRIGDVLRLRDSTRRTREFTVTQVIGDAIVAEGQRGAFVREGAMLVCNGDVTRLTGIPRIEQTIRLAVGDRLLLTSDPSPVAPPEPGAMAVISCTLPEAVSALQPGDPVLFDDGVITAVVESVAPKAATLRVTRASAGGKRLSAGKGINMPRTPLPVPVLSEQDLANLPFVVAQADLVAFSFVRRASDVADVLSALHEVGADDIGIIVKVESAEGFRQLPSILLEGMRWPRLGVMIARGDLAVEMGFEQLPDVQKQMLRACEAAHVPAIWATQVLDLMARTGLPSRAEATDAAAAQRAECVMLNKGPFVAEAIEALDQIHAQMDAVQLKGRTLMPHLHSWDDQ